MIVRIILAMIVLVMLVYIGKKAWIGFHKAVGISHKTMHYVEYTENNHVPILRHLTLADATIMSLPRSIKQQLERIDSRVATYEAWKDIDNSNTTNLCEDDFVLTKLITTHLPEMIDTYLHIQQSKQHNKNHQLQNKALLTLQQCLADVEYRFGQVIDNYESQKMENLEAMKRYLKSRR